MAASYVLENNDLRGVSQELDLMRDQDADFGVQVSFDGTRIQGDVNHRPMNIIYVMLTSRIDASIL